MINLSRSGKKPPRLLCPLTREAAESTGHIAWIEDSDPQSAYRRMHDAVKTAPFNCAVWADAGKQLDSGELDFLNAWRSVYNYEIAYDYKTVVSARERCARRDRLHQTSRDCLTSLFNKAATNNKGKPDIERIQALIESQIRAMASDVLNAVPVNNIRTTIRGEKTTHKDIVSTAHTDGPGTMGRELRFIQSLASPGTCVVANEHSVYREIVRDHYGFRINPDIPVTIWQVPENSVTLLTNELHHCQPILHSEAPTLPGQKPAPRTVLVCDLTL